MIASNKIDAIGTVTTATGAVVSITLDQVNTAVSIGAGVIAIISGVLLIAYNIRKWYIMEKSNWHAKTKPGDLV